MCNNLKVMKLKVIKIKFIGFFTVLEPPTCQGDLLGKQSQLDLILFGVGVLAVGRKVMP